VSPAAEPELFVWALFQQLLRRGFAVGPQEYRALRDALRQGFGWSSRGELREVFCALWAKSREERAVMAALFDQQVVSDWNVGLPTPAPAGGLGGGATGVAGAPSGDAAPLADSEAASLTPPPSEEPPAPPATVSTGRLPSLTLGELPALPYAHVFLPQYPVGYRTVAQAWRRLRWPVREGPATELDVEATVRRRSQQGVVSPPVLRPRRRNRARLLLLVDRQGSMAPFHSYVDMVVETIGQAGRLRRVARFYFHDTPLEGADTTLLDSLQGQLFPRLDPVLAEVPALLEGELFDEPELVAPRPARAALAEHAPGAAVVIVSDGGAARGRYDLLRLLDTVAFLKGLRAFTSRIVWLNPLPAAAWTGSTAAQLARHLPMFPMDRDGMHRAVNVLRGQPFPVEKPLPAARGAVVGP
jgi:uncharacterized protein with von Willebrand factor type A (vWA) domain